jgi:hypothetical protein
MFNCRKFSEKKRKLLKRERWEKKQQQKSFLATLNHPGAAESSSRLRRNRAEPPELISPLLLFHLKIFNTPLSCHVV